MRKDVERCPKCRNTRHVTKRGTRVMSSGLRKQLYQCQFCGRQFLASKTIHPDDV